MIAGGFATAEAGACALRDRKERIASKLLLSAARSTRATVLRIIGDSGSVIDRQINNALRALSEVGEASLFAQERELHHTGRPVALLCQDQLRRAGVGTVRIAVVDVVAVDQHDDVGVLFEGAGFAQIRQLWTMVGA